MLIGHELQRRYPNQRLVPFSNMVVADLKAGDIVFGEDYESCRDRVRCDFRNYHLMGYGWWAPVRTDGSLAHYNNVVDHQRQTVWMLSAKCASTTIKRGLLGSKDMFDLKYMAPDELAFTPYRKVAVMRDPVERMGSCWADKVVGGRSQFTPFGISCDTSFRDFIEIISRIPDGLADTHFRSQTATMYFGGVFLADEIKLVDELTELPQLNPSPRPSSFPVSDYVRELIRERFARDYKTMEGARHV